MVALKEIPIGDWLLYEGKLSIRIEDNEYGVDGEYSPFPEIFNTEDKENLMLNYDTLVEPVTVKLEIKNDK